MILAKEFEGELWIKAADHDRAVKQAVEAEREACAKVCEVGTGEPIQMKALEMLRQERERIAKAIRARGDALTRLNKAAEDNGEEL